MTGLFPSNFVAILEDFPQPISRLTESPANSQQLSEKKSARRRVPFIQYFLKSRPLSQRDGSPERPRLLPQASEQSPPQPSSSKLLEVSGGDQAENYDHDGATSLEKSNGSALQQEDASNESESSHQPIPPPPEYGTSGHSPEESSSAPLSSNIETYVQRMELRLAKMQQKGETEVDEPSPPKKRREAYEIGSSTYGKHSAAISSARSDYTESSAASSAGLNSTILPATNAGGFLPLGKKASFFKKPLEESRQSQTTRTVLSSTYEGSKDALDWLSTRRDINRSNTPGPIERSTRADRCQMLEIPVIRPVDKLHELVEGGMAANGTAVRESVRRHDMDPASMSRLMRKLNKFPSGIGDTGVIQSAIRYLCRAKKTEVQKLTAIFLWCATRLLWYVYEGHGGSSDEPTPIDTAGVINRRGGTSREIAAVVVEMCLAVGIPAHMVRGRLKNSAEAMLKSRETEHWWNAVIVDNEWRFLDVPLAGTMLPYETSNLVNAWYFLTPPTEFCWTHIPRAPLLQHLVPPAPEDVLRSLPTPRPEFFHLGLSFHDFDTSLGQLEGLELCTISINVPAEIDIVAEVSVAAHAYHSDDNAVDNGDFDKMRALSQPSWHRTTSDLIQKRFVVKALLPDKSKAGVLRIHAGKMGLRHSI
ncbi:hypothetical protein LTS15_004606 [Exophiala xenobiotica]|nr:hypothetical protein LTS15_004606 [Exophiala xenobiotica]